MPARFPEIMPEKILPNYKSLFAEFAKFQFKSLSILVKKADACHFV